MTDDTKIDFEALYAQNLERSRSMVADFWQGHAAYWQTVADIMGARASTASNWWQALPEQWQAVAKAQGWPAVMEQFVAWQQQNWLAAWHLGVDTHHQRTHLFEQWQKMAERNGMMPKPQESEKPVVKSSYFANRPQPASDTSRAAAQPAPQAKTQPAPAPQQAAQQTKPAAANGYIPQPPGIFIPGPGHTNGSATHVPQKADEPNGHEHHAAPEPARNAAQAATLAGATSARRSVVASHRSRASRHRTH